MICPICKNEIKEDSKFCPKCGKQIPRCPSCNKVITKRMKFCINDGTPLPEELFSVFSDLKEVNTVELKHSTKSEEEKPPLETMGNRPFDAIPVSAPTFTSTNSTGNRHYCVRCGAQCPDTQILCPECQEKKGHSSAENIHKKKKRKILPFLCIVLFLGVAGALGYSIYNDSIPFDLFSQKSTETPKTETESDKAQTFIDRSAVDKDESEEDTSNLTETLEQIVQDTEQTTSSVEPDVTESIPTEQDSLVTEEQEDAPPVSMDAISNVTATSYLTESEYGLVHHPSNLVDGSLANAWVEDVSRQGEGEAITIQLNEIYTLSGFNINAGYQKSADAFAKNSRPATLLITFSDGSSIDITLQDINEQQQVNFPSAIETSSVTLTIQSIYPGSKYEDTAISEIQLF